MAHLDDLVDVLNGYFRKKASDVWLDKLDEAGVPAGPILSIGEMLEHPQALARDMIVETEHQRLGTIKGLGMAVKFHGAESIDSRPPPAHGQHSTEVLLELGYSDSQIQELYATGVVSTA